MLQKETVQKDPNAIAHYMMEPLDKHRNERVLNEDEMHIFFALMTMKDDGVQKMLEEINKSSIVPRALMARQKAVFNNNMLDEKCIIAITTLTEGNIGRAIMYLYYCQWWAFTNNVDPLFFDFETEMCTKIFPMGVFKDDTLHKIWDDTKVSSDNMSINLIDISYCANSFIKERANDCSKPE